MKMLGIQERKGFAGDHTATSPPISPCPHEDKIFFLEGLCANSLRNR